MSGSGDAKGELSNESAWIRRDVAIVAAGAVAAASYAPDSVDKLFPSASGPAHRLHDLAFGEKPQPAPQAQTNAGPPPALVSVAQAKRQDYPVTSRASVRCRPSTP